MGHHFFESMKFLQQFQYLRFTGAAAQAGAGGPGKAFQIVNTVMNQGDNLLFSRTAAVANKLLFPVRKIGVVVVHMSVVEK